MATRFELNVEAERFIHNDLSICAWSFQQRIQRQIDEDDTTGMYHTMMASLVFCAFSIEAKVNFVGWKKLEEGWPEQASIREKINLLKKVLPLSLGWGERPLQTVSKLFKLRNTLAHGKPEIVDDIVIVDEEPDIWDALKAQWEATVTPDFVNRCLEDEDALWEKLLEAAEIEAIETLTHGGHSLKTIVEPEND